MAALPTTTTAFSSGATEAQFKTFLTGQRDYLVGLFGADGTAATAKATLGTNDGVTAVNGSAGAISAAQIAAAATAGYGYAPAHPDAAWSWDYCYTSSGSAVNLYANWGSGIYCAYNAFSAYTITPSSPALALANGYLVYKLRKL